MTSNTDSLLAASAQLQDLLTSQGPKTTLPSSSAIQQSISKIISLLPSNGLGPSDTAQHLLHDITPGLNGSSLSPSYYGFVTGGSTPIARLADQIVGAWDQNVAVHLPAESVATVLEDRALAMLLQLFELPASEFVARTFTTGATASNILGLACGRDFVLASLANRFGRTYTPEKGLLQACIAAGVTKIHILTTSPHSSLGKAANIVGLGSECLIDVSTSASGRGIRFDMDRLEACLSAEGTASIVAVSCSEVNLGGFATTGLEEMQQIRRLCDQYGAWLHVDAAFGLFANLLPDTPAYAALRSGTAGMHLADSITSDGHKLLNVPYDTGIFFSRHAKPSANVFSNPNAPYLRSSSSKSSNTNPNADVEAITSPLNLGLENSRRWRALPVYANLVAYGQVGLGEMVARMVDLARAIARFITLECEGLEVLFPESLSNSTSTSTTLFPADDDNNSNNNKAPDNDEKEQGEKGDGDISQKLSGIFMIVAFRAKDGAKNESLVQRIKYDRRIYVSGTVIDGRPAARIAVAKWDVDVQRDLALVRDVLRSVA